MRSISGPTASRISLARSTSRVGVVSPGPRDGIAHLTADGFEAQWIFADDKFAQLIHRVLQRSGERPTEESDAETFDPFVRQHSQGDELKKRPVKTRPTRQRLLRW